MNLIQASSSDKLILASGSPRRREILQQLGVGFEIAVPDTDETVFDNETPELLVCRLSTDKANAVAPYYPGSVILAADTVVVNNQGEILGKPTGQSQAIEMLMSLSGKAHHVYSGLTMIASQQRYTRYSRTRVEMIPFTEQYAVRYWQTGEPEGKAGAYAIQGLGAALVQSIQGSYTGVVGLPVEELIPLLELSGIGYWQPY